MSYRHTFLVFLSSIFFSFLSPSLGQRVWLKSQRFRVQYPVRPHTVADSRRAVVNYWQKYVHEELVNRLGGLSLPIRLTDRPGMTLDVYCGRKTTTQKQQLQIPLLETAGYRLKYCLKGPLNPKHPTTLPTDNGEFQK